MFRQEHSIPWWSGDKMAKKIPPRFKAVAVIPLYTRDPEMAAIWLAAQLSRWGASTWEIFYQQLHLFDHFMFTNKKISLQLFKESLSPWLCFKMIQQQLWIHLGLDLHFQEWQQINHTPFHPKADEIRPLKPLRSLPMEGSLECDHTQSSSPFPRVNQEFVSPSQETGLPGLLTICVWFKANRILFTDFPPDFIMSVCLCLCVCVVIRSPLPSLRQKGPNDYARRFAGSAGCARICLTGRESCQHEATGWQVMKS